MRTVSNFRTWKLLESLRRMRLGKEGEEYVGQELNLLMCRGAHVFHDIPYAYGNIDHLVVGFDKVVVVETKAISKPKTTGEINGRESKIVFDGSKLTFPHMTTKQSIIQAKIHAKFVRDVLKKKYGFGFTVVPVVAIPGWFVESKKSGARRMVETAALLVDHVLPYSPVRQWVLSFPYPLRFVLANHPQVIGKVLGIVNRAISTYLRGPT